MKTVSSYKSFLLDCDGVILNSNFIKTEAYFSLANEFGRKSAEQFVTFHRENGGVSRFAKLRKLLDEHLGEEANDKLLAQYVEKFGTLVKEKLMICNETPGLRQFLQKVRQIADVYVVSASPETELKEVFYRRELDRLFDGIYGSPRTKQEIVADLMKQGINQDILYVGDSRLDYEVAKKNGLDFIFMHQFSEFDGWRDFFLDKRAIKIIRNLLDILPELEIAQ